MNKKSRKLLTWCLVLSMVLTQVLFTNVALAATRHEGTDRYQTALSVVKAGWTTAETVVIAQGEELADALAAAPLAYAKGKAPILLTEPNKLPEGVLDELTALGTKTVYIVGGTGAVSSDVEAALAAKVGAANVIRLGGADRVETALKVANAAFGAAPTGVVLAGAYAYADALSASSIAAAKGMPILLVDGKLTDAEASYVAGKTVYAVGGTGVLPDAALPTGAKRLAGLDRYATNAAILGEFDLDYSKIYLAKGEDANMVDALAGSALAALTNSPIVLVDWNNTIASAKELLSAHITDDSEVIALGGSAVVPNSVIDAVEALKPSHNTTELKVESVTAENLKQIKVTFNKAVTDDDLKDEVEDEDNYEIRESDDDKVSNAIESAELDDSGKVVTLTLKDGDASKGFATKLENQEDYKLVVSDDILDTETTIDFTPEDTEIPETTAAEVVGIDTVKVHFTEPIKPDNADGTLNRKSFEVNGGDLSVKRVELVNDNTEANVILYSDLKDGEELTVKVKSEPEDYAGYSVKAASYNLTVVEDTEAPYVTGFKNASRTKVTLVFNEDIKANGTISATDIYHTNKNNPIIASGDGAPKINGNELTIHFTDDNKLPAGTAYIYIKEETLQDLWENLNPHITAKIQIDEDNTKPTVKKVEQGDTEYEVVVTFSEDVDLDTAEDRGNYTIKDSDGDEQRITKAKRTDSDEVTLTTRDKLDSGDEYSIIIEDVEDLEGNEMEKYEGKFTMDDKTANDWSDVRVSAYGLEDGEAENQRLIVDFDEPMTVGNDKYAVDDLDKYVLYVFSADTTFPDGVPDKDYTNKLPLADWTDADIRALDNNEKVEIDIPFEKASDTDTLNIKGKVVRLAIARVADKAGNITDSFASGYLPIDTDTKVALDSDNMPKATDTDVIEFAFNDKVDLDNDDIKVYAAKAATDDPATSEDETQTTGQQLTIASFKADENSDGNTAVTLELDDDDSELNYDGTFGSSRLNVLLVINGNGESENDEGAGLKAETGVIVDDGIAPAVVTNNDVDDVEAHQLNTTTASIVIHMEEPVNGRSFSTTTFEPEDYTVKEVYATSNSDGTPDSSVTHSNLADPDKDLLSGGEGEYVVVVLYDKDGVTIDKYFGIDQLSEIEDLVGNSADSKDFFSTEVNIVHQ